METILFFYLIILFNLVITYAFGIAFLVYQQWFLFLRSGVIVWCLRRNQCHRHRHQKTHPHQHTQGLLDSDLLLHPWFKIEYMHQNIKIYYYYIWSNFFWFSPINLDCRIFSFFFLLQTSTMSTSNYYSDVIILARNMNISWILSLVFFFLFYFSPQCTMD